MQAAAVHKQVALPQAEKQTLWQAAVDEVHGCHNTWAALQAAMASAGGTAVELPMHFDVGVRHMQLAQRALQCLLDGLGMTALYGVSKGDHSVLVMPRMRCATGGMLRCAMPCAGVASPHLQQYASVAWILVGPVTMTAHKASTHGQ